MNCVVCGTKLVGQQTKYCSTKCTRKLSYLKNRKRYIDYAKKWQKENPRKAKEIKRKAFEKFRKNNREKHNAMVLANYYKNKEKRLAYGKEYYLKNKDEILAKRRARYNKIKGEGK